MLTWNLTLMRLRVLILSTYRHGLPSNPNSYGSLTDLPDYTFVDGRRTPAGSGKLRRAKEQEAFAVSVCLLTSNKTVGII
jgi:hypothetical protein